MKPWYSVLIIALALSLVLGIVMFSVKTVYPLVAGRIALDRGISYGRQHDYARAVVELDKALEFDPKNLHARECRGYAYIYLRRFTEALSDFDIAIEQASAERNRSGDTPQGRKVLGFLYANRAGIYQHQKMYAKAVADAEQGVQITPNNAQANNQLAWLLATCPDARLRDGKRALPYAQKACALTSWHAPDIIDTLAAAQAESGDFTAAVHSEQQAAGLLTDKRHKDDFQQRVRLYRERKPYREP